MDLIAILRTIASTGPSLSIQAALYTLHKTLLDRPYRLRNRAPGVQIPGELVDAIIIPSGARFQFAGADLEIVFLSTDLARLSWGPALPPLPYALARTDWPSVISNLRMEEKGYILSTQELRIEVAHNGSLNFYDRTGRLLRNEYPPERLVSQNGSFVWKHKAVLNHGESLYGLGERAAGLDLRGGTYRLWNNDPGGSYPPGKDPLYLSVPAYSSLHSGAIYLVFYENSFPGMVRFPAEPSAGEGEEISEVTFEDGLLRMYFIPGPPQRMLERFTELTGRAPLPPRWVLGYHQSRWGYKSADDVRQVLAGFREHDLPLNALHLDIDYMDGYRVFTIDTKRFPDLKALSDELHQQGVRLVTIIDAGVKKDTDYSFYQSGLKDDIFCRLPGGKVMSGLVWPGKSVFPDFTDPQARRVWGEQYGFLVSHGVDGIWHDMNEPTSFVAWGDMTLPLSTRHELDGRPGDHRQAHNYYGLLMNRATYESLQHLSPEHRPWIISRSGYAGLQRYAWSWTGDSETSWRALRNTIGTVLGLGLSGIPFSGPDIGGFSGSPSAELYIRWLQLAAFLPFFRTHSSLGTPRREPWVYGEPYTSIARHALKTRQRLLPYLYTSVWQTCQNGIPMARPLFWLEPEDERLRRIDDTFLLGDNLLVAPALQEGACERELTLPSGTWFNLWDDTRQEGPAMVKLPSPIDRIPVLARGGGLLPMDEDGILALHAYPIQGNYNSQVFHDAGDGYGPYRLDQYTLSLDDDRLSIHCEPRGEYGADNAKIRIILHGINAELGGLRDLRIDGKPATVQGNQFECGSFREISLRLNHAG
jgi:alpha-glucosidase